MRAVLFDVDGVLLDSTKRHRLVWSRWSEMHDLDFEAVWAATHGRRPVDTFARVAAHLDPETERLVLAELLATLEQEAPAFPGAASLLTTMAARQWAVVTSGERSTLPLRFTLARLPQPPVLIAGDEVHAGKPDPEGYLRAAAALHASPADCLVVEDAPAGVAAGKAAGMTVLAIESTHEQADLGLADRCASTLLAAGPEILRWVDIAQ